MSGDDRRPGPDRPGRGNPAGPPDDLHDVERVDCAACREELSARLDGEDDPAARPAVDAHLAGCAACARWAEHAAVVTRRVRTAVAEPGPDLVERVLPAAPAPVARWRRVGPRVGLAVVGGVQLLLGAAALLGGGIAGSTAHGMTDGSVLGAGMAHMNHETAAWNLALGAAFLAGARWRRHLAGLLPVLGAFVAVLAVVSVVDLVAGRVGPDRVVSHVALLAGLVLTALVSRSARDDEPGPAPRARVARPPDRVEGEGTTPAVADPVRDGLGPVAHERRRDTA